MFREKIVSYVRRNQKGDVLVIAAISLAAVMFCGAAVVDLGSLYSYKSQLQNAADAAALAGAHAYVDNEETPESHPEADEIAEAYVERNLGTGYTANPTYQAKETDNAIYYRVSLKDRAQTYFLKYFHVEPEISVDGIAAVSSDNGNNSANSGKDLFIFRKNLTGVNSIDNPDNFDTQGQIRTTFDGTIAFTDGTGKDQSSTYKYNNLQASTQSSALHHFFTQKSRDESLSVNQAIGKGSDYAHQETYVQYDMNELGHLTREMMGIPDYVSGPTDWSDWQKAGEQQQKVKEYASNRAFNGKKDMTSSDLSHNVARTADPSNGDGNVSITIDSPIPGNTNDPVYVYLDESVTQINFNVNASNNRPLILVYTGTGKLQMNMSNNNTFRGIVYAPNVNEGEGVLINANGGTFSGSIIANSINLQGGRGTFEYESFNVDGASGGAGNSGTSPSSKINLVNPDDISWD